VESIRSTCDSIVAQTSRSFEWIVIDGGSTDGTLDVLENYSSDIGAFVSEADSGIYQAMNKGSALASGDYLVFLNGGDCFFGPDALKKAECAGEADVIVGYVRHGIDGADILRCPPSLQSRWLLDNMLPHQAAFIKRKTFEKAGKYNEAFRIAGDYELFARLFVAYQASYIRIPSVISIFARGGVSQSSSHRALRKRENHCIRWQYFPRYRFTIRAWREAARLWRSGSSCPPPLLSKTPDLM
jgi:glycosyltransferase involved in cell wall biosynthesis